MYRETAAEVLFDPGSDETRFLPEGPTALGPGRFSWVAIQHGADATWGSLNIYDMTTGKNEQYRLPGRPGFAKPTTDPNCFVVGCERQLGVFNIATGEWTVIQDGIDGDVQGTIINDGTTYADNLVFGTKDLEFKTQKAGLYLYRAGDGQLVRMRADQVCSNGKDVIDRGTGGLSLIDIDSPTKKVVRYQLDIEAGTLSDEEVIVDLNDLDSVPDGMVLSPDEQSMIISFYNPNPAERGETRQYSMVNGELEHIWYTHGSPQATCPLLMDGGNGGVKLIITTAVEHMPADRRADSPTAGCLFIADTPFTNVPSSAAFPIEKLLKN